MSGDSISDQELLMAMQASDSKAFHALYMRYWKPVFHFAFQKTRDVMTAEDIVQDIFISLWNRREELNITSNLKSYLMVSIKYRIIKLLDKQRAIRLQEDLAAYDILDNSTQEWLEFEELRVRLEELVLALPEKYEIVYRMHKEEGMSHKQIAKQTNLSEQAVNSRLVRARKILANGLQTYISIIFL